MLIVTRSPGQEVRIGEDVVVRVVGVRGEKVRLGIEAPAGVPVHRKEVFSDIKRNGKRKGRSGRDVVDGGDLDPQS